MMRNDLFLYFQYSLYIFIRGFYCAVNTQNESLSHTMQFVIILSTYADIKKKIFYIPLEFQLIKDLLDTYERSLTKPKKPTGQRRERWETRFHVHFTRNNKLALA